jgi:HlyD family secretion protein
MSQGSRQRFGGRAVLSSLAILHGACGGDLELAGTVERRMLELAAPVAETVVELPLAVGSRVEAGGVVARLDSEVATQELRAAEAAHAATQAGLREAEEEFRRTEGLARARVASASQLDRARRLRDEALAADAERAARVAQARKTLAGLALRSAVDGVLDQLPFELGERVPAGAVLAVVLADERPWVRVWIPARAVSKASPGSPAEVRVVGVEGVLAGRLEHVAHQPEYTPHYALTERESEHLAFQARVALEGAPAGLRPGLGAQVRLRLAAGGS